MRKLNIFLLVFLTAVVACTDLHEEPYSIVTNENIFKDPGSYRSFTARLYAGLAISGQQGPAGDGDIKDIDEGFSNYLRQYWKAQELTTDEAVTGWGDDGLSDYHEQDWTPANQFITAMYNRIFYQVTICNEFLRETTESKLDSRGVSEELRAEIAQYRSEARFLRALSYWHGIDIFGNIPLITEDDEMGAVLPKQATRAELFTFVEKELKAIEDKLGAPKTVEYGRADQAAAWMVLAKLYLNAKVYIDQDMNTEALTYCNKIIASPYGLSSHYQDLFTADNNTQGEIIFPVCYDGNHTQNWGGATFLIHAAIGGSMKAKEYGVDGGWWGLRTTSNLVDLFPDVTGATDHRAIFYTDGQTKEINNIGSFNDGYAAPKFRNVSYVRENETIVDTIPGKNETFPDTDFPMFRLADAYLMYAEAILRDGKGGSKSLAVGYINQLRERAYGNTNGNISEGDLDLDFILDERGRELYWEGHRRTDLIRFGLFTENGIWPWKGNVKEGKTTEAFRNIFPIPSSDLIANPTLDQNYGY